MKKKFNVLEYIDESKLAPAELSEQESISFAEEKMGITEEGNKLEVDIDVLSDYINACIILTFLCNQAYIYNYTEGVYRICDSLLYGRIIKYLCNQIYNAWNMSRENAIIARIERDSDSFVDVFNDNDRIIFDNGVYDVRNFEFTPNFSFTNYNTIKVPIDFNPSAECPTFLKYISSVTMQDTSLANVLQELLGYCLTSSIKIEKAFILYGVGRNGKSVFAKVIRMLLGEESVSSVPFSQFATSFGLESLIDKTVNISAENDVKTLNTEKIKAVISGDKMSINRKNKQHLQIALNCKLVMLTNNLPNTNDTSFGFFRKIMIIPFNNIIPEDEVDINLFSKLECEKSGILNWALVGLKRLVSNGYSFSKCKAVDDIVDSYRRNQDDISAFISDCVKTSTESTPKSKVYGVYSAWCSSNNVTPKGRLTFWEKFKLHFVNINKPYRVKSIHGTEYISDLDISID
jgi:putative DNA primase/helicase